MDVLLVNAPVNKLIPHVRLSPPLGLAYIGAVLLEAGYSVSAIDLNTKDAAWPELRKLLTETPPKIVGISAYTETYLNGLKVARLAREINPEVRVVIGGPHASTLYGETVKEDCIDIVARGEGEQTMLELAGSIIRSQGNLADIDGIVYKDEGEVRTTGDREPITDVDKLPHPARHLFRARSYKYPVSILTSRGGCPFACHFCAVNNIWKGKRRFRKPEEVAQEFLHMTKGAYRGMPVNFSDDTFTLNREYVLKICSLLKSQGFFAPSWQCSTRVDLVDAEIIREMKFAGCYSIQYGVEAGSQQIIDSIGKNIRLEQVREAVRMTLDYGVQVTCSFMFPQPEDTEDTIKEQIELMKELRDMGAALTLAMTTPLPGTYYYEHADEIGIKILPGSWDEYDAVHLIITTKHLGRQQLEKLLSEMVSEVGMERTLVTTSTEAS